MAAACTGGGSESVLGGSSDATSVVPGGGDPSGVPESLVVTPAGESWFDPEVLAVDGQAWMTWQDGSGGVWLAELSLVDGSIRPGTTVQVASDGASMRDTFNGPELGLDAGGVSVWYTAATPDGQQVAKAEIGSDGPTSVELMTGVGYVGPLPSRRPDAAVTRLVALRRPPGFGTAVWFDETAPEAEAVELVAIEERGGGDARWVAGTGLVTVAGALGSGAAVELVDTDSGEVVEIGARVDGGAENPYGWVDPATGRVWVLAVVGGAELVVWEVDDAGMPHERTRLASPDSSHPHLGSPEPFLVDGRPWVSLTVTDEIQTVPGRTDQQVWLVPLDGGAPVRCDDGAPAVTTRVDPEVIVTAEQVLVYYYAWDGSRSQVQRCRVDLRGADTGVGESMHDTDGEGR